MCTVALHCNNTDKNIKLAFLDTTQTDWLNSVLWVIEYHKIMIMKMTSDRSFHFLSQSEWATFLAFDSVKINHRHFTSWSCTIMWYRVCLRRRRTKFIILNRNECSFIWQKFTCTYCKFEYYVCRLISRITFQTIWKNKSYKSRKKMKAWAWQQKRK